ncbi:MAG: class I SAM-dependent methyltransferase [Dysgonamonadaceae bacterium]|jgi:tRNA G37 N-methylase Trm5|nr:class I SAM-dependent methyltransferase [Dysgonamonadaceae bacterium]
MEIDTLYQIRFSSPKELASKNKLWQVLCKRYFSKYVNKEACVLDMAAGYCEFINNIEARKKIAVDINPDTIHYAGTGVQVIQAKSSKLEGIESNSVDVVFISNFFEHLTKEEIISTLSECKRVLNKVNGGG